MNIFKTPIRLYNNILVDKTPEDIVIDILEENSIDDDITIKITDNINGYSHISKTVFLSVSDNDIVSCSIAAHESFHVVHYNKLKNKLLIITDAILSFLNNIKILIPLLILLYLLNFSTILKIVIILSLIKSTINLYTEYYANNKAYKWLIDKFRDYKIEEPVKHIYNYVYISYIIQFIFMLSIFLIVF